MLMLEGLIVFLQNFVHLLGCLQFLLDFGQMKLQFRVSVKKQEYLISKFPMNEEYKIKIIILETSCCRIQQRGKKRYSSLDDSDTFSI